MPRRVFELDDLPPCAQRYPQPQGEQGDDFLRSVFNLKGKWFLPSLDLNLKSTHPLIGRNLPVNQEFKQVGGDELHQHLSCDSMCSCLRKFPVVFKLTLQGMYVQVFLELEYKKDAQHNFITFDKNDWLISTLRRSRIIGMRYPTTHTSCESRTGTRPCENGRVHSQQVLLVNVC